jgi:hypothetical protein
MRRPLAESIAVAVAGTLAAALLAWPWPLAPTETVVGDSFNDQHSLAWTLQWVAERLAAGDLPWGYTDAVRWPDGGTLYPADLLEAVLLAPVTWAAGGIAALGALTVLHHGLAAGATWGWLRARGADAPGALAGALAVALAPWLVVSSWNGNPDVTGIGWAAAALWLVERERPGAAGAVVGLSALANPYPAVIGGLAVGARLLTEPRALARAAAPMLLGFGAAWLLVTQALEAPDALIERAPRAGGGLMGTATLLGLLDPRPEILDTDPVWGRSRVGTGAYLGLAALLAAVLARRDRGLGWGLVALGAVAALGPELRLFTAVIPPDGPLLGPPRLAGTGAPLPWALAEKVPGLDRLHQTARFTALSTLGLALLVAQAPARLGRARWVVALAICADLLMVAGGARLLGSAPAWDDGACAALRGRPDGPVLDLPPTAHELDLRGALCHGQPVAGAINRPIPPSLGRGLGPPGRRQLRALLSRAADLGFAHAVVHRGFSDPALEAESARLPACVVAETDSVRVVDLGCLGRP